MTLPLLEKTWTISGNQVLTGSGNVVTDRKALFLTLKNKFVTSAWTVSGSCNATSSSGNGVDHIQTIANIVNTTDGTAHSWIVLQQSQISPKFQVCFDFSSPTQSSMTIVVSPVSGFSGSSLTRRPTAVDEYLILSNSTWFDFANYTSSSDIIYNTWFSSDGMSNRVITLWNNNSRGMWMFERPPDAPAAWREKSVFVALSGLGEPKSGSFLFNVPKLLGNVNELNSVFFMTAEGTRQGPVNTMLSTYTLTSSITGKYPLLPLTLFCGTANRRGVLGRVADMWYGPSLSTLMTGTTFPESGSAEFVQFGHIVQSWDAGRNVRIG